MMNKLVILVSLSIFSWCSALYISESHPKEEEKKNDYHFDYTVHDPEKELYTKHSEVRQDGEVKGYYSLKEADGSLREVHYTAGKGGYKAVVTRNGVQVHPHTSGDNPHEDIHSPDQHEQEIQHEQPSYHELSQHQELSHQELSHEQHEHSHHEIPHEHEYSHEEIPRQHEFSHHELSYQHELPSYHEHGQQFNEYSHSFTDNHF